MKLRNIFGIVVLTGFGLGIGLIVLGHSKTALLVWAIAASLLFFGERVADYVLYTNPVLRKRRQEREHERRETWRRATEWERGRVEREAQEGARMYIAKLKQDNRRTSTEHDPD